MALYSNAVDKLQNTLYNVLNGNGTVMSTIGDSGQILDGMPVALRRGIGGPYIIIHTPEISERRLTQVKMHVVLTSQIEVVAEKEENVRKITDAIREAIKLNQQTSKDQLFFRLRIERSNLNWTPVMEEPNRFYWHMSLYVVYEFFSSTKMVTV